MAPLIAVLELAAAFLFANAAALLTLERRSRQLQWQRFTQAARDTDAACRKAGWILVDATFRPGYLHGRGVLYWRHRDGERCEGVVIVDAAKTTREAVRPF